MQIKDISTDKFFCKSRVRLFLRSAKVCFIMRPSVLKYQRWARYKIKVPRYRYSILALNVPQYRYSVLFPKVLQYRYGTRYGTLQLYSNNHWRSQKFWLWRGQIWKKFVTLFWWHFRWRNGNDDITIFLKFNFVIISLKKHNLAKSRSFMSPIYWMLRGAGGGDRLALGNF